MRARRGWGWIAFGAGLAVCVIVGGVFGVVLGKKDSSSGVDPRSVAALALDARGLSEDAVSLARAFESAAEREELEREAEELRFELNRLDMRAARIQARARAEIEAARDRGVTPAAWRGLREIQHTVKVFERDVVGRLESVVGTRAQPVAAIPDGSIEEALADVNLSLEDQDRTLAALAESLERVDAERTLVDDVGDRGDAEDLVVGDFEGGLLSSGQTVTFEYELGELEAAREASEDEFGEAEVTVSATGSLNLVNEGRHREVIDPSGFRLVLFWPSADLPAGAFGGSTLAEGDPCQYEIEGELHCALVRLGFEWPPTAAGRNAAGSVVLASGKEIGFGSPESEGSLAVAEDAAESVADLIESSRPAFIQVLAAEGEEFAPACTPPVEAATDGITLGLLSGEGDIIFGSAATDPTAHIDESGYRSPPECFGVY